MTATNLSRRAFIQSSAAVGAGLVLGFHIPQARAAMTGAKPITKMPEGVEVNAWLSIDPTGLVPCASDGHVGAFRARSRGNSREHEARPQTHEAGFVPNPTLAMKTAGMRPPHP